MMIDYEEQFEKLKTNKTLAQGILAAVKRGLYSKSEALEAIQGPHLFHLRYIGGPPEQNAMADELFKAFFDVMVICHDE